MFLKYFRKLKYKLFFKNFKGKIGSNVNIEYGTYVYSENIFLGNNVHIGFGALWNALGTVTLGNNIIIGPKSTIWTFNHNYKSSEVLPYDGDEILKPVIIEDNVWIGANVIINPGVTISEGSIVAMGSVVTKDTKPCEVVGGNPAKKIGERDNELYKSIIQSSKDYSYLSLKQKGAIKKRLLKS